MLIIARFWINCKSVSLCFATSVGYSLFIFSNLHLVVHLHHLHLDNRIIMYLEYLDNLILQTKHTQRARSAMTWDKEPQRRKHNVTLRLLNKARRYSLPAKGFAKAISRIVVHGKTSTLIMEQSMETSSSMLCSMISISAYHLFSGGRRWIRTIEAEKQQIYSLPPLATRELSPI